MRKWIERMNESQVGKISTKENVLMPKCIESMNVRKEKCVQRKMSRWGNVLKGWILGRENVWKKENVRMGFERMNEYLEREITAKENVLMGNVYNEWIFRRENAYKGRCLEKGNVLKGIKSGGENACKGKCLDERISLRKDLDDKLSSNIISDRKSLLKNIMYGEWNTFQT